MKPIARAFVIVGGVLLLIVIAAGAVFYVKVYRPIGSPLMAIAGAKSLEDRRLQNHSEFVAPGSEELTAEQAEDFAAVEEAVEKRLATGTGVLARKQADLEEANAAKTLSVKAVLAAYGDIRGIFLDAKLAQIDAMNRANLSKSEFEWIRRQLYRAEGMSLSQVDVSDILAGVPDPAVTIRRFDASEPVERNRELARPLASRLQGWSALAFFGL